jgi:hypothetical protein
VSKPKEEEIEVAAEATSANAQSEEVREGAAGSAPDAVGASTRAKRFVLSKLAGSSKGREAVLSKAMGSEKQVAFRAIVGAVNQCKLTCVVLCFEFISLTLTCAVRTTCETRSIVYGKDVAESFQEDVVKLALKLRVLNSANVLKNMDLTELQRSLRALGDEVLNHVSKSAEEREALGFAVVQTLAGAFADLNASYFPKLAAVMTEKNASRISHVCSRLGDPGFLRAILTTPEYEDTRSDLAKAIQSSGWSSGIASPTTGVTAAAAAAAPASSLSGDGPSDSDGSPTDSTSAGANGAALPEQKKRAASSFVLVG